MNRFEEIKLESLQDSWVIMYTFVARSLFDKGGFEGECAIREAVRRYGCDRGLANRTRLIENNIKINMETLFCEGRDRPGEPRFLTSLVRATEQERVSDTLICSFADVWKKYDAKHLGRIYCEEFHIKAYETFGFGKTKVNLTRTLTQDGDDRCCFYHTYRPENLSEQELKLSFEEYDPGYKKPETPMPKPQGKSGFNMLWIKMYFYLLEAACEQLGDLGKSLVAMGLKDAALEQVNVFKRQAENTEQPLDRRYFSDHLPLDLDIDSEPMWDTYGKNDAKQLLRECYYSVLFEEAAL